MENSDVNEEVLILESVDLRTVLMGSLFSSQPHLVALILLYVSACIVHKEHQIVL